MGSDARARPLPTADLQSEGLDRIASKAHSSSYVFEDWTIYHEQALPKILRSALDAFAETGYHGTSTRVLAKSSMLSVPGMYHHYVTKQHILFDLMMLVMDELLGRTKAAIASASETAKAQLDAMVTSMLLFHMHRQKGVLVSIRELGSLGPDMRSAYLAQRADLQCMLDEIILRGIADGAFETPFPAEASRAIQSLCVGLANWYRSDGPLDAETLVARHLSIVDGIVGYR
ncbi:TetR/AcrR family transcriptional regulator [Aeromicrobium panaciterrae]|uniref:TetR/AcrR family transcriptional regulator n=1 Tax=Aeromicrobium panaciterrae TaxID=363861 RepID=UPI0031D5FB05